jgi:hypothetical protein
VTVPTMFIGLTTLSQDRIASGPSCGRYRGATSGRFSWPSHTTWARVTSSEGFSLPVGGLKGTEGSEFEMAVECGVDDCGISCEFGCACMSDAAGCECWCENVSLPPLAKLKVRAARDPETYVDFTASEMPLTRLAEMFDDLFPGQILIPARKLNETVTTDGALRRIKLADLVEHVGLVPRSRPLRRTTST